MTDETSILYFVQADMMSPEMRPVTNQLQANLLEILRERGLSQMALSKMTHGVVSQGTISQICRGRATASDVIAAIAKALDVPMWRLLVDKSSDVAILVDSYMSLDPGSRDFVKQVIERELPPKKNR